MVREAIQEFRDRIGKLRVHERFRALMAFDELVSRIPLRPLAEMEHELKELRRARGAGGRRSRTRKHS